MHLLHECYGCSCSPLVASPVSWACPADGRSTSSPAILSVGTLFAAIVWAPAIIMATGTYTNFYIAPFASNVNDIIFVIAFVLTAGIMIH